MENVAEFVLLKKSSKNKALGILHINSSIIKTVLSLHSKTNKVVVTETNGPLVTFVREMDARADYAHLVECRGDTRHLSDTSLQYTATQLMTNFRNLVDRLLWPKTLTWVRQEMIDLQHDAETSASPGATLVRQNADVRNSVNKWLSHHVASKPLSRAAIERASGDYDSSALLTEFQSGMRKMLSQAVLMQFHKRSGHPCGS